MGVSNSECCIFEGPYVIGRESAHGVRAYKTNVIDEEADYQASYLPRACAPDKATISLSLKPMR